MFKISWRLFRISSFRIVELENQSLLGKHSSHFKNSKTSLKNNPIDKSSMNNVLYFATKYLKWNFKKVSHETGSIKYGPGIKYLLNMIQHVQYFTSRYLKRSLEKSHMKSGPSNIVLI